MALTGSQEVRGVGGVDFCGSLEGFMGRQLGKVEGFVVRGREKEEERERGEDRYFKWAICLARNHS